MGRMTVIVKTANIVSSGGKMVLEDLDWLYSILPPTIIGGVNRNTICSSLQPPSTKLLSINQPQYYID